MIVQCTRLLIIVFRIDQSQRGIWPCPPFGPFEISGLTACNGSASRTVFTYVIAISYRVLAPKKPPQNQGSCFTLLPREKPPS
jgi:hypothetical protein